MQRVATRVFVGSSIAFGLIGAVFFVSTLVAEWQMTDALFAVWGVTGCIVLSSLALSVAAKYLGPNS